jgi:hypothetical protein
MPNCFQSNRPETAFSCAIGATARSIINIRARLED